VPRALRDSSTKVAHGGSSGVPHLAALPRLLRMPSRLVLPLTKLEAAPMTRPVPNRVVPNLLLLPHALVDSRITPLAFRTRSAVAAPLLAGKKSTFALRAAATRCSTCGSLKTAWTIPVGLARISNPTSGALVLVQATAGCPTT